MKKPKTAADGYSDSYFDEGEIYRMMAEAEESRKKKPKKKPLDTKPDSTLVDPPCYGDDGAGPSYSGASSRLRSITFELWA